jgi:hypothetical protein
MTTVRGSPRAGESQQVRVEIRRTPQFAQLGERIAVLQYDDNAGPSLLCLESNEYELSVLDVNCGTNNWCCPINLVCGHLRRVSQERF